MLNGTFYGTIKARQNRFFADFTDGQTPGKRFIMDYISQQVYDILDADTAGLDELKNELASVENDIRSGRFNIEALNKELYPKKDALNRQLKDESDRAIEHAKKRVDEYRKAAEKENVLDASKITDDIKLLQPGITLLERDIEGILNRNKNNRTMVQIVMRYAKEHNIPVKPAHQGFLQEENTARQLDTVISYYAKWIDKPNAKEMLDKFFQQ